MDRRDALKVVGGTFLAGASCSYAVRFLAAAAAKPGEKNGSLSGKRWGMVIDLTKCKSGCTACIDACHEENGVAPRSDKRWDVHWIRKVQLKKKSDGSHAEDDSHSTDAQSILLLCNHCDHPPCAQVCPVRATFRRKDGIVIVDHHRCIGCRYCMIACPYNARHFNFKDNEDWPANGRPKRSHGVAEACTLCAHRLDVGRRPACVEACEKEGAGAIVVDNLADENSEGAKLIAKHAVKRIRPDLGTEPKVHYIGL